MVRWADIIKHDVIGWWGITGKGIGKRWCLSLFLKAGSVEIDERWHGNLFQKYKATDENDLDFAIAVFRGGTHIDKEEEDRSDRVGRYRGMRAVRIGWLLELQNLEIDSGNLKIYSVANRKQMQIRKNGRDATKTRFFCDDPIKYILNKLYASQVWNRSAIKKTITIVQ